MTEVLSFFGHQATSTDLGLEVFSQWFEARMFHADVQQGPQLYRSCEHWMMARKALLFGDLDAFGRILESPTPRMAKLIGREVRGFDEAQWAAMRFQIVVSGNLLKFTQHPRLGAILRSTADAHLVEASPYDHIWGAGIAATDPRIASRDWPGLNLLGEALMRVRSFLVALRSSTPTLATPAGPSVN